MASRPSSMHMRAPSLGPGGSTSAPQLQQKIQEKRQELQDLRTLRELSGTLAKQMEDLAQKLETLTDGTAAVATVMANWGSVLRAVRLASEHIPRPKEEEEEEEVEKEDPEKMKMPVPLVRIAIEDPPAGEKTA